MHTKSLRIAANWNVLDKTVLSHISVHIPGRTFLTNGCIFVVSRLPQLAVLAKILCLLMVSSFVICWNYLMLTKLWLLWNKYRQWNKCNFLYYFYTLIKLLEKKPNGTIIYFISYISLFKTLMKKERSRNIYIIKIEKWNVIEVQRARDRCIHRVVIGL